VLTQTVRILLPGDNYAIAAAQPFQISEATDARFALVHVSGDQVYEDITSLRLQGALHSGDVYTVVSETSNADEESLRSAPTGYPQDIRERYLALPATVPARVRDLALQITAGADNNYDKAHAIEKYLRENIKYDESVAPPPPDVDAVDYLLFERPAGYCNYYASAMAVLAREVGIPARVASGYSLGDSDKGVFHVIEGNAHSWPELYFGKYGWIDFEPTSSKPEIVRPIKQTQANNPAGDSSSSTPEDFPRGGPQSLNERLSNQPQSNIFFIPMPAGPVGIALGAGSGTLLLVLLTAGIAQLIWTQRMRFLSPAARAWEEMYRFARWAGFQDRRQATPFERAEELARVAPDSRPVIAQVTDLYVRERYGKQTLSPEELERAERARAILSKRLLRRAFENMLGNGPRRIYREVQGKFGALKKRSSTGDKLDA
ncbi:MAG TPA: transglutaminase domain-containing protein, partial [Candidatus Binataceae bacterium]|nr:transglutaminase domain-containing protein [Candidatus Binataceae bacterium]